MAFSAAIVRIVAGPTHISQSVLLAAMFGVGGLVQAILVVAMVVRPSRATVARQCHSLGSRDRGMVVCPRRGFSLGRGTLATGSCQRDSHRQGSACTAAV
jgi:hypothetical protein